VVERVVKWLALVLLTGCPGMMGDDAPTLPSDAFYVQVQDPCDAPSQDACRWELAFCTDGSYEQKLGDIVTPGNYVLEDSIAVDNATGFTFSFQTQTVGVNGIYEGQPPWSATTMPYDTSCPP
jgi:hypothetical protein